MTMIVKKLIPEMFKIILNYIHPKHFVFFPKKCKWDILRKRVIPSKENVVVDKHDFYSKKSISKKSPELPSIHLFEFKKSKSLLSRFLLFSK